MKGRGCGRRRRRGRCTGSSQCRYERQYKRRELVPECLQIFYPACHELHILPCEKPFFIQVGPQSLKQLRDRRHGASICTTGRGGRPVRKKRDQGGDFVVQGDLSFEEITHTKTTDVVVLAADPKGIIPRFKIMFVFDDGGGSTNSDPAPGLPHDTLHDIPSQHVADTAVDTMGLRAGGKQQCPHSILHMQRRAAIERRQDATGH